MNQQLHRYAVRAGTGNSDMVWLGLLAPNKHRAIKLARVVYQQRVKPLADNQQLLVEVRT